MGGSEKRVTLRPPGSSVEVAVRESQAHRYEAQGFTRVEPKRPARRRSNGKNKEEGDA